MRPRLFLLHAENIKRSKKLIPQTVDILKICISATKKMANGPIRLTWVRQLTRRNFMKQQPVYLRMGRRYIFTNTTVRVGEMFFKVNCKALPGANPKN